MLCLEFSYFQNSNFGSKESQISDYFTTEHKMKDDSLRVSNIAHVYQWLFENCCLQNVSSNDVRH